jgi:cell division inhibitor SepF
MASMWRRTMVYLGLADEDDDEAYGAQMEPEPVGARAPAGRTAEAGGGGVRTLSREAEAPPAPARPAVVRPSPAVPTRSAQVHLVSPTGFDDAQEIGDKLKTSQPVIVNLQGTDRDLSRRIIDFSSGLAYGLEGQMERVADQVFLLTPSNVEVPAEERRRLRERGLYRS